MKPAAASSRAPSKRSVAALALLAVPALAAAAGIPASFHGTWVRDEKACSSGPLLMIHAERLRFVNDGHSQRYTKLLVEPSSGGRAAPGTLEVLADLPDGSPFLLFLTPGSPPLVNLNWRPLEDQLAKRFPLAPSALKRCPG
ncbi:MAG: hypothetical protein ACT6S0_22600 [Roseateles sp.]|uniref:hypothetical protein n=1 Tax=Roseateles sp. TaxID=1971397 RepID=UPI004035D159